MGEKQEEPELTAKQVKTLMDWTTRALCTGQFLASIKRKGKVPCPEQHPVMIMPPTTDAKMRKMLKMGIDRLHPSIRPWLASEEGIESRIATQRDLEISLIQKIAAEEFGQWAESERAKDIITDIYWLVRQVRDDTEAYRASESIARRPKPRGPSLKGRIVRAFKEGNDLAEYRHLHPGRDFAAFKRFMMQAANPRSVAYQEAKDRLGLIVLQADNSGVRVRTTGGKPSHWEWEKLERLFSKTKAG